MMTRFVIFCLWATVFVQDAICIEIDRKNVENLLQPIVADFLKVSVAEKDVNPRILEDTINSTIESLRPIIPDPITIDNLPIELDIADILSGKVDISNIAISGLKDFQVPALKLMPIGYFFSITLNLPLFAIQADFNDLDMTLLNTLPVTGKTGNASIQLIDLKLDIATTIKLNLTGAGLTGAKIQDTSIKINLGAALFHFAGLYDSVEISKILGIVLDIFAPALLNDNADAISDAISPPIEEVINTILGQLVGPSTTTPQTDTTPDTSEAVNEWLNNRV